MSVWGWLGLAAGIPALLLLALLFLFRLRYRVVWEAGGAWEVTVEAGLPGWRRRIRYPSAGDSERVTPPREPDASSGEPETSSPAFPSQAGFLRLPRLRWDRERFRRAAFRLLTDPGLLVAFAAAVLRLPRLAFALLDPRIRCTVGHADPALLGRAFGAWQAVRIAPVLRRADIRFGFGQKELVKDVEVRGGFSAAGALAFAAAALLSFPWFLLLERAWRYWRRSELEGWRAWVFAKARSLKAA